MPRISPQRRQQRVRQVMAGARRCFGRYGYTRSTVSRLEEEIGLSRGAIFNYFPSKLDLFVALAAEDADRAAAAITAEGIGPFLRRLLLEDPDWMAVYLEVGHLHRTDPEFREAWEARGRPQDQAVESLIRRGRRTGAIRTDVPVGVLVRFLGLIWDGLVLQRTALVEVEHAAAAIDLAVSVLGPSPVGAE